LLQQHFADVPITLLASTKEYLAKGRTLWF